MVRNYGISKFTAKGRRVLKIKSPKENPPNGKKSRKKIKNMPIDPKDK